jgi:hypothetical protein
MQAIIDPHQIRPSIKAGPPPFRIDQTQPARRRGTPPVGAAERGRMEAPTCPLHHVASDLALEVSDYRPFQMYPTFNVLSVSQSETS